MPTSPLTRAVVSRVTQHLVPPILDTKKCCQSRDQLSTAVPNTTSVSRNEFVTYRCSVCGEKLTSHCIYMQACLTHKRTNVNVFYLDENGIASHVYKSRRRYGDTAHPNVYDQHLSYITNAKKSMALMFRKKTVCSAMFFTYDFEAYLEPMINEGSEKLTFTHRHIPISVSSTTLKGSIHNTASNRHNDEGRQCFLHENSNTTNVEDREGYVYSNITSWPKFWLGLCATHNCSTGEKCVIEDGQRQCRISECVDVPSLPNASIPYGHRGVNDTRAYNCDVGLTTDSNMTCGTDGQWKYHNPPCQPVSCGSSENITHASKEEKGTEYTATVEYTCKSGYSDTKANSVIRHCQDNGNWSNETLNCQAVSCGSSENITHASKVEEGTKYPDTEIKCSEDLVEELANDKITASSTWESESKKPHGTDRAKLSTEDEGSSGIGGWSAQTCDEDQYIQAEFPNVKNISAVATKGRAGYEQWVTAYSISYSIDGSEWLKVNNSNGQTEVFTGNNNTDTLVVNVLPNPVNARFIRINPTNWHKHITMRFGVKGCDTAGSSRDNGV
ncbi:hypothetical protein ScPMuIL_010355 [Solemya velum]